MEIRTQTILSQGTNYFIFTKYDFRDLSLTVRDKLTAFNEGVDLARKIGAVEHMECSAKTGKGVKELFERALKVGYKHWRGQQQKKNAGSCQLMRVVPK